MLRRLILDCKVDASERRPHLGGALGAALLKVVLIEIWMLQELDSRALGVTILGDAK